MEVAGRLDVPDPPTRSPPASQHYRRELKSRVSADEVPDPPARAPPTSQSRRRGLGAGGNSDEASNQSAPRARARLTCGFGGGCICCGPSPQRRAFGPFAAAPLRNVQGEDRNLAAQAASVDGCRDAAYVDTHCHFEMVLQKLHWYESAPSLLEERWDRLTESERRCWKVLGFTRALWQNGRGGSNSTWFRKWHHLSNDQRSAAEALGWVAETWNAYEWLLPEDVPWSELGDTMRRHLSVLGETSDSWDETFCSREPAGYVAGGDMRRWQQLSDAEREAAAELGFCAPSWNMDEMAEPESYFSDFCGSGFQAVITQGCDSESFDDTQKLVLTHSRIYAAFGCHPKNAWLYEEEKMEERILACIEACGRKVVAWGECGLDYSNENWGDDEEYRLSQMQVFERQLHLAVERSMPLVLHIRVAAEDAFRILKQLVPRDWKAHIHAFHGPTWFVNQILDLFPNFVFGITGTVSMFGDGTRMARIVPLERMVLETDGPYMVPRGTTFNHVGQIPLIARLVAQARGCDVADVEIKTRANSRFIYGI